MWGGLALAAPASAATADTQSSAQAVNLDLASGALTLQASPSGGTTATNDGTQSEAPTTKTPAVSLLGGQSLVAAGALSESAEAAKDGSSYACAGVLSSGGGIAVGTDGTTCTATGTGTDGVSIDLNEIPGVGTALSGLADITVTADSLVAHAHEDASVSPVTQKGDAQLVGVEAHVALVTLPPLPPVLNVDVPVIIDSSANQNLLAAIANALLLQGNSALVPLINALSSAVSGAASLTTNYQAVSGGELTVSALHIALLDGSLATADIAKATVGPNSASTTPPVISSPTDGATVTTGSPTISGTGTDGDTVTVVEGTTTLCSATVASDGSWSCAPMSTLSDGSHTVSATQSDGTTTSAPSEAVTFTVDTAPTASGLDPDHGPTAGGTTVTMTGAAFVPGDTSVAIGGDTVAAADVTVASSTSLSFVTPAHAAGDVDVTATTAGGTSGALTFTYDAPAAPVITSPADGATVTTGLPPIAGTGAVGDGVTVVEGTTTLCSATVFSGGSWSCTPTSALSDGSHTVSATQSDGTGTSAASAPVTFTVDTTSPAPPAPTASGLDPDHGPTAGGTTVTVTGTGFSAGGTSVTIGGDTVAAADVTVASSTSLSFVTPAHAAGDVDVTATTGGGTTDALTFTYDAPAAPVISSPADGATVMTGSPMVSGTGTDGDTVTTVEGASTVCSATVASGGSWSCTPTSVLSDGSHTISATQSDGTAISAASAPVTFTVDTVSPAPPAPPAPPASPAPTATSLAPDHGPAAGGTSVTVGGSGFVVGQTTVAIGGTTVPEGTVTVSTADSLTFVTPAGTPGATTVTVTTPSGKSAGLDYTYDPVASPAITEPTDGSTVDTGVVGDDAGTGAADAGTGSTHGGATDAGATATGAMDQARSADEIAAQNLAVTGTSVLGGILLAIVLLAAGAASLVARRRRA